MDSKNLLLEVDMTNKESVLDALILALNRTHALNIVFNNRSYFFYTLTLFGFSKQECQKAWEDRVMNIDPFGLVQLNHKMDIGRAYIKKCIAIFPDPTLIRLMKDKKIDDISIIHDPQILKRIMTNEISV
jgi:hypothetical protein